MKLITLYIWLVKCITSIDPGFENDNPSITKTSGKRYRREQEVLSLSQRREYHRANGLLVDRVRSQRGGQGGEGFQIVIKS